MGQLLGKAYFRLQCFSKRDSNTTTCMHGSDCRNLPSRMFWLLSQTSHQGWGLQGCCNTHIDTQSCQGDIFDCADYQSVLTVQRDLHACLTKSNSSSSAQPRLAQPSICRCNTGIAGTLYIISNGTDKKRMPAILFPYSHTELVQYK